MSKSSARPFDVAWARSVVRQCKAAAVACFVKQYGSKPFEADASGERFAIKLRDKKGGDPAEMHDWARVREFPHV